MIPKKIHYCWFGRGEKPKLVKKCIASWKKYCPEYEIIEWNEDNFDIDMNAYTRMCYDQKKYAFLTDYVRLIVVQKYGGIYFDTDVEIVRNFDDLLDCSAFFGFETEEYINTGLGFGAEKENEIFKQMVREYDRLLDGKNGYLCNVKDGEDLYCKIKQFIELPYEKCREMGKYARKFVTENFNKTDVVNKTIKEIEL